MSDYQKFLGGYIAAIFFTETGEPDQPAIDDELSDYSKLQAGQDCRRFWQGYGATLTKAGADPEQAGHDFWLTRQGHGAGFWDRPKHYGKALADELTRVCRVLGEVDEMVFKSQQSSPMDLGVIELPTKD